MSDDSVVRSGAGYITLDQLYNRWLREKYQFVPEKTKQRIIVLSDKYILDAYKGFRIRYIDDSFAQEFLQNLITRSMRNRDRKSVLDIIRDICEYAVKKQLLRYNPFLELRIPAAGTARHHSLSEDDVRFIMNLDTRITENAFFQIKLLTGTRTAECLGLCWENVDFARKTITINDQLQYMHAENKGVYLGLSGHLKNFKPRTIRPPDITFELLAIRKQHQKMELSDEPVLDSIIKPDYVFADKHGDPISPRKISAAFRECMPNAAERGLRLHDLRITNATMEYRQTGDLRRVQKNLGHASPDVTIKYYIDPDPKDGEKIAMAIDEYFRDIFRCI